ATASRRVTPCMGQSSTSGRARFQPWHPRAPAAGRQEPWDEQEVWRDDGTGRRNGTAAPGRWGRPFEFEGLPRAERDHFFVLATGAGGGTSQTGGGGNRTSAPVGFCFGGMRSRFLCVTGGRLFRYAAIAMASSSSRIDA